MAVDRLARRSRTSGSARDTSGGGRREAASRSPGRPRPTDGYPGVSVNCAAAGKLRRRRTRPPARRDQAASSTADEFEHLLRSAHTNSRDGSTIANELALRPGFSPQARVSPTAQPAPRGAERWVTGSRCGARRRASNVLFRRGPPRGSHSVHPPGVLAPLFLLRKPAVPIKEPKMSIVES